MEPAGPISRPIADVPAFLTRAEVAERLGVCERTLRRHCPAGVTWIRIGRTVKPAVRLSGEWDDA